MRKYRIREEVQTSRDKTKTKSIFFPEYNGGILFIPLWQGVVTGPFGSTYGFNDLAGAKLAIEKDIQERNEELIHSKDIIYKVCIQKSKKSIDIC